MSFTNGSNGPPAGSVGGAESVIEVTELNEAPAGTKKSMVDLSRSSKTG